jgi:hypothetical protein
VKQVAKIFLAKHAKKKKTQRTQKTDCLTKFTLAKEGFAIVNANGFGDHNKSFVCFLNVY